MEENKDVDQLQQTSSTIKNKKRVHYPQANGDYHRPIELSSSERHEFNDELNATKGEQCSSCCRRFSRRWNRFVKPWKEFFHYQPKWSWVILVAAFLTYSIGEALTSVFPIVFVALQKEFPDEGSSNIALVQSMMNAVPCLLGPIASIVTTRLGYRKTTMLGGAITSLSLFATSFANHLKILYITMGICYAFGNSLVLVATVVAVTEHFDVKPSFASGVTISGGAFGQCVFAIVLQKLFDIYRWNGAMMLFSGIVLCIVAFGALFREVEWDEEEYDDDEGEDEETENGNELPSSATGTNDQSPVDNETIRSILTAKEDEQIPIQNRSNTPPSSHKPSFTDDIVFYDPFTKQGLFDQYSKSEICLPSACREELHNQFRQHQFALEECEREIQIENQQHFDEGKISSSTNKIEQIDNAQNPIELPVISQRSNSFKTFQTMSLSQNVEPQTTTGSNNINTRKTRSHHRRARGPLTNTNHENRHLIFYYPLHHQHPNISFAMSNNPRTHSAHHHHHHHHPLHVSRGNLSHLALCSKNIYNYESVLNLCKIQSLHFPNDRSLSLPNLYSPMLTGKRRRRSITIKGNITDYREDVGDDENRSRKKSFFAQTYRDICELVRVLRILPFLLLCISVTMVTIFYDATWTFILDYMTKNGLPKEKGTQLISSVGIIAIFGEIGYGYLGDSERIFPLHVYSTSLLIAGLSQLIIPLVIKSYSFLMPLMLFTSFLQSAQEVLMPILCIKFAGTQNFANAYGMLLLCQGISSLIGPPSLGYVADQNSYDVTYFVIGGGTAFGASLLFTMPLVERFYEYLKPKDHEKKLNTLVTASNGDLPSPTTVNQSENGTV